MAESIEDRMVRLIGDLREQDPIAFDKAADLATAKLGVDPRPLFAARPDLAAMQASIPQPTAANSVQMQAAAQRAADRPYLEFDGARWYLERVPDMFDLGELGEAIDGAEQNPVGSLGAINHCLRSCLADYPGLRARFRQAGGGMDDYVKLATGLFEAAAARPTGAPADSSGGREPTSTSSRGGGPSPVLTGP